MRKTPPNGPFYLPPTPKPKDLRKYNAFGFRKDFGLAYSAYYRKRDKRQQRKRPEK